MIDEIRVKYGEFSDSWISKIEEDSKKLTITITCSNKLNSFTYEVIKLEFIDVLSFQRKVESKDCMITISEAFLELKKDKIVFDIDPVDYFDYLEENENSGFKIVSEKVNYSFIECYKE